MTSWNPLVVCTLDEAHGVIQDMPSSFLRDAAIKRFDQFYKDIHSGNWKNNVFFIPGKKSFVFCALAKRMIAIKKNKPLYSVVDWIRSEEDFAEKWNYIAQNPVKEGLAATPNEYRWWYGVDVLGVGIGVPALTGRMPPVLGGSGDGTGKEDLCPTFRAPPTCLPAFRLRRTA